MLHWHSSLQHRLSQCVCIRCCQVIRVWSWKLKKWRLLDILDLAHQIQHLILKVWIQIFWRYIIFEHSSMSYCHFVSNLFGREMAKYFLDKTWLNIFWTKICDSGYSENWRGHSLTEFLTFFWLLYVLIVFFSDRINSQRWYRDDTEIQILSGTTESGTWPILMK